MIVHSQSRANNTSALHVIQQKTYIQLKRLQIVHIFTQHKHSHKIKDIMIYFSNKVRVRVI